MSKLKEALLIEASIHGGYSLAFANMVGRLKDITDEVEKYGSEINIAFGQGIMKYTGKGNIQVQLLNLKGDLQKVTNATENVMKSTRKLK
jgi:hypothetical protein